METTYIICAAVGGTLIVCQFLLTLLGMGGDHDAGGHDGGHDFGGHDAGHAAGHHHAGHGNESSWYFGLLTFRTLSAAVAFFGLTGLVGHNADFEPQVTLIMAVGAGLGAMFLVAWIMQFMTKLNVDGTVRIDRALGSRGTVYLTVPAEKSGEGKVMVDFMSRTMEYKAVTAQGALPTGSKVVVVGVLNSDTVEVASTAE
ncbi:MAG: hypothetical protein L0215_26365 [Gemmataceae bacterium]|nr:hypothetical protein [Gemmataceae bacterium]